MWMFQHTYKGSKRTEYYLSIHTHPRSSIPTRVRNSVHAVGSLSLLGAFQHTYKGSKHRGDIKIDDAEMKFQHTYKGSKHMSIFVMMSSTPCSSIPTRVRNSVWRHGEKSPNIMFQHTYKGSKLEDIRFHRLRCLRSSIPTRVRNGKVEET